MSDPREEILDRWEGVAAGWKATREAFQRTALPVSQAMIEAIHPQPGQRLLELAAGLGDTGLLAAERVRPGGTVTYSVCTLNRDENEAVVDASGLEPDPSLGEEWPDFRHPSRPEFLLTLPHVHRTSGFFIARLRIAA